MIQRFFVILSLSVAGCGGDICSQDYSLGQRLASQEAACGDAGSVSVFDAGQSAFLAQCETAIKSCTPAEQANLGRALDCYSDLPAFQCKWLSEGLDVFSDPTFLQYDLDSTACTDQLDDAGISKTCNDAFSISSSQASSSNTPSWSGTYTVQAGGTFSDGNASMPVPSGTETISQSGTTLTWTNFGSPSLPSCTLTATASDDEVVFSSNPCGAAVISGGSASLSSTLVSVSVFGSDPSGNDFSVEYSMSTQ